MLKEMRMPTRLRHRFSWPTCAATLLLLQGCALGHHFQGRAEAEEELRANRSTVYTYGLRNFDENLDQRTGLPYRQIAGCVVGPQELARARGHNDRLREHIFWHGLPPESRKPWERELFDLRRFCSEQAETALPLAPDDPMLMRPDDACAIELRSSPRPGEPQWSFIQSYLYIVRGDHVQLAHPTMLFDRLVRLRLHWLPPESDVAVIEAFEANSDQFSAWGALDLRTGNWLRIDRMLRDDVMSSIVR